jgi:hypothetical protein
VPSRHQWGQGVLAARLHLLDDSSMMISLQLKGAQLSCVLAEMTILIVSYGGVILKFQITIKNGMLSLKP